MGYRSSVSLSQGSPADGIIGASPENCGHIKSMPDIEQNSRIQARKIAFFGQSASYTRGECKGRTGNYEALISLEEKTRASVLNSVLVTGEYTSW
jgi:hypothetical protein